MTSSQLSDQSMYTSSRGQVLTRDFNTLRSLIVLRQSTYELRPCPPALVLGERCRDAMRGPRDRGGLTRIDATRLLLGSRPRLASGPSVDPRSAIPTVQFPRCHGRSHRLERAINDGLNDSSPSPGAQRRAAEPGPRCLPIPRTALQDARGVGGAERRAAPSAEGLARVAPDALAATDRGNCPQQSGPRRLHRGVGFL